MMRKNHKLSWSNTRITLLDYCEKKYFLNYYTSALKNDFPQEWKLVQILKRCKSLDMWIGEKTHYVISDYLNAIQKGENTDFLFENCLVKIDQEMRSEFAFSKVKDFSVLDFTQNGGLSEHFYGEDIDDKLDDAIGKVKHNFEAFVDSEWGKKVISLIQHHKLVYVEEPRVPDFGGMKVVLKGVSDLENVNIMASPDFGVMVWDREYYILDRKTGKEPVWPHGLTDQLKVYVLKLLMKSKGKAELWDWKISAYEVYLPSLSVYGGGFVQQDIDDILTKIRQDVEFQKKFLVNEDPLRNEPVDSIQFSRTLSKYKCETCTFRKVCDDLALLKK